MIYETYTCSMADGTIEFGFCFKAQEGDEDCCTQAEIVVGVAYPLQHPDTYAAEIQAAWDRSEWMAKAIVAAAP